MGMDLAFHENRGPVFSVPIRTSEQVDRLTVIDGYSKLEFVMNAIQKTKSVLKERTPLIGFSGAPWTLAVYMVEGRGSKEFREIKQMVYRQPGQLHKLLEKITESVTNYLKAQVESGIDALQIFDTWGGILSADDYKEFSLRYIKMILSELKKVRVPKILFSKGQGLLTEELSASGIDALSLDWQTDLGWAKKKVEGRIALQGNLDPAVLYAPPEMVRAQALKIMLKYGKGNGHVFNLGHGISPDMPVENVKLLVKTVQEESGSFH
jgi:uroporphyrinogen decarboxylase